MAEEIITAEWIEREVPIKIDRFTRDCNDPGSLPRYSEVDGTETTTLLSVVCPQGLPDAVVVNGVRYEQKRHPAIVRPSTYLPYDNGRFVP